MRAIAFEACFVLGFDHRRSFFGQFLPALHVPIQVNMIVVLAGSARPRVVVRAGVPDPAYCLSNEAMRARTYAEVM